MKRNQYALEKMEMKIFIFVLYSWSLKKNYNLDWILKIGNRKYEIERLCFTFKLSFQKLKFIVSANINSL